MDHLANENLLLSRLEELFLNKNYLQPSQLIERFEEIVYSRYETEADVESVNEILQWYEEEYGTEEHRREEIESIKIHNYLTRLVYTLDEGYFSAEEGGVQF